MKHNRVKITVGDRKKAFISLFILTLLLMIGMISIITQKPVTGSDNIVVYAEYKVQEGDTLWSIASEYNNSQNDIRETVYLIGKINDREDGYIHCGEILKVPLE